VIAVAEQFPFPELSKSLYATTAVRYGFEVHAPSKDSATGPVVVTDCDNVMVFAVGSMLTINVPAAKGPCPVARIIPALSDARSALDTATVALGALEVPFVVPLMVALGTAGQASKVIVREFAEVSSVLIEQ
jgi:hypothetical protein